ncbi:hypothetical protein N9K06_01825, partial [Omnitrophica bacterium]|nr:hypothetical protein [Candidatus Omnitrophota bacterium]
MNIKFIIKMMNKATAVTLSLFLVFYSVPQLSFSAASRPIEIEDQEQAEKPVDEQVFPDSSLPEQDQDFVDVFDDAPLSEAREAEEATEYKYEGVTQEGRVTLDYAMSQAGNDVAVLEVLDMESISIEDLQEFRSADFEHGIFFVEVAGNMEAVYVSSGDEDHIRVHDLVLPYLENPVFV